MSQNTTPAKKEKKVHTFFFCSNFKGIDILFNLEKSVNRRFTLVLSLLNRGKGLSHVSYLGLCYLFFLHSSSNL